jgi:hypothetical protein
MRSPGKQEHYIYTKEESITKPILFAEYEVCVVQLDIYGGVSGDNWAD